MEGKKDFSRREFLRAGGLFAAGVVSGALGKEVVDRASDIAQDDGQEAEDSEIMETFEHETPTEHAFFDTNPDFLRPVTPARGEWTKEQRAQREEELGEGVRIFRDVGVTFYYVQPGDTILGIREKLSRYPEFDYLADQHNRLNAFNIPEKRLRVETWIPIPIDQKDRHLTQEQFIGYANEAIDAMSKDAQYGQEVERILKRVNKRDLVVTMMALAKQEGGGLPLGQYALHRYEPHQNAFSYSYFHVLMKGAGLEARRALNLTEGQVYHPFNAVKLFLAFLVEKTAERKEHAERFFPILEHKEAFAVFYNGAHWKEINPDYVDDLERYYREMEANVSQDGRQILVSKEEGER
ncbi:hypothetical protein CO174_01670 [Candidatus Uhrbacteria bacterium CG_4_9_14_3_um_filter_50_9]|uniref:Uncharacterized protein n=1 Tax=Candidatus Uhrbacteria bacterium CG_4_9_14_3_um_filter_50_9 TaxID=1975035 RepID=A0A2M7XCZ9_9BACT|nr:MAG: hypothetical protein CO174_01670 [Candidatus Uhrbacteria bacterium CG_4_9_14_3_um_filter_50_9]